MIQSVVRGWKVVARTSPTSDPMGMTPMTMNRIVAVILPSMASGVTDCRRLTWLIP